MIRKLICSVIIFVSLSALANDSEKMEYVPNVHGVIRARYEADLNEDLSRFQVRNARVSIDGKIAPPISYFVQVDFCDRGKILFLDAWGKLNLADNFSVQAGQFRIPFGVEPFMAPVNYLFNNRSFIGKQICNFRGTGVKLSYNVTKLPLTFEIGAFNSATKEDHTVWSKHLSYSAQAIYKISNTTVTVGFETIAPYAVRMNNADVAIGWKSGRWWVQGEYMCKHYCRTPYLDGTHGWLLFTDYSFPVKWGIFNRASVQGRYDGMTNNSNGIVNGEGVVAYSNAASNRATAGGTVTYVYKRVHADIRVNYEKYFYHSNTPYPKELDNLLSAELVVRF